MNSAVSARVPVVGKPRVSMTIPVKRIPLAKRALDVLLSGAMLTVTAPVLADVISSRRQRFFRQNASVKVDDLSRVGFAR